MKVPEEFVDVALEAVDRDKCILSSRESERLRAVLEAVLPKMRERLVGGEAARAGVKALEGTGTEEEFEAVEAVLYAAFDAAFPEDS